MKKIFIATLFVFFAFSQIQAQDYNSAIGLRGGLFSGVTLKHFINHSDAVEGLLVTRWEGVEITGLYEVHDMAFNVPGLNWYYGGGAHIGFYDENNVDNRYDSASVLGVDGILGIEYNFMDIPLNIGLDWKPSLNLLGGNSPWGDGGALSIRYVF